MTDQRITQLSEQINNLVHRGLCYHDTLSKPLYRAKTLLSLLVQTDADTIKKNTWQELIAMAEDFIKEIVEIDEEQHDYLLSFRTSSSGA